MEVINGFVAEVFYRVNIDEYGDELVDKQTHDKGQTVKWVSKYKIRRFPTVLSKLTSYNYLFSPNFTYQLDFLYS